MKEKLTFIGALVLVIGTCFTIYFYFDQKYAHADDFKKAMEVIQKIESRLDYKITQDRLNDVRKDIYAIEDKYCPNKSIPCNENGMPEVVVKRYRELKLEKDALEKELKGMDKGRR